MKGQTRCNESVKRLSPAIADYCRSVFWLEAANSFSPFPSTTDRALAMLEPSSLFLLLAACCLLLAACCLLLAACFSLFSSQFSVLTQTLDDDRENRSHRCVSCRSMHGHR